MKKKELTDGPPCEDMEALLQQVADGSAKGIRKYFAMFHVTHCHHCGSFLKRMRTLISVIRDKKENLTPMDAMDRLKAQIQELETKA